MPLALISSEVNGRVDKGGNVELGLEGCQPQVLKNWDERYKVAQTKARQIGPEPPHPRAGEGLGR